MSKAKVNGIRVIPTEDEEQIAVMSWARLNEVRFPALRLLHHIPNGGKRGKREAAIFKAMGVKAGVPDLFMPCPKSKWHGLYIEMKALDGKPSQKQKDMAKLLVREGYCVKFAYGADEAIKILENYLEGVESEERV